MFDLFDTFVLPHNHISLQFFQLLHNLIDFHISQDACWASHPNFEVIQMLIEREPDFLMLCDKRGHTPLAYVRREKWGDWCRFLSANRAMLIPKGNILSKNTSMNL